MKADRPTLGIVVNAIFLLHSRTGLKKWEEIVNENQFLYSAEHTFFYFHDMNIYKKKMSNLNVDTSLHKLTILVEQFFMHLTLHILEDCQEFY
jgi:hypothetical protein